MRSRNTDVDWEYFGATDPYFGVITHPRFLSANLSSSTREEFFQTGRDHVAHVLAHVRRHIDADFVPQRVLDFGCGVGRLLVPFARVSAETVGADVAASMLDEARRNCHDLGADNVQLVRTDDTLAQIEGTFDLVHSFIVFQHIPVARGMAIFDRLLDLVSPGGVGALHFVYGFAGTSRRVSRLVKKWLPGSRYLINLVRGRPVNTPVMEMNAYDLAAVLQRLLARRITVAHVELTDHGGELGVLLYFSKP